MNGDVTEYAQQFERIEASIFTNQSQVEEQPPKTVQAHVNSFSRCTVVILINATTLMHKSTLNTNNFGNNHFGQKYQKQNILRIFRRI